MEAPEGFQEDWRGSRVVMFSAFYFLSIYSSSAGLQFIHEGITWAFVLYKDSIT